MSFVEELPGAYTQGMIDEARENLCEAIRLVLDANRAIARESVSGAKVIREPLELIV
jgi:predicted RNase H-like HicB family nuclease